MKLRLWISWCVPGRQPCTGKDMPSRPGTPSPGRAQSTTRLLSTASMPFTVLGIWGVYVC